LRTGNRTVKTHRSSAMTESYYLQVEGHYRGPYSVPQIRSLYARGFVAPETPYWQDGMEEPRPIHTLFQTPPVNWAAIVWRWILFALVVLVPVALFLALWRDRILAFADSPEVSEFLRKAIYILFFKQDW
jgi:hypothetical protein